MGFFQRPPSQFADVGANVAPSVKDRKGDPVVEALNGRPSGGQDTVKPLKDVTQKRNGPTARRVGTVREETARFLRDEAALDASTTPGAATTAPTAAAPAAATPAAPSAPPSAAPATAGAFQIAVAAFKTESRARGVAESLAALKLLADVRPDSTGVWFRVIAGPFATREAAVAAQDALTRGGYAGTRISPAGTDPR